HPVVSTGMSYRKQGRKNVCRRKKQRGQNDALHHHSPPPLAFRNVNQSLAAPETSTGGPETSTGMSQRQHSRQYVCSSKNQRGHNALPLHHALPISSSCFHRHELP